MGDFNYDEEREMQRDNTNNSTNENSNTGGNNTQMPIENNNSHSNSNNNNNNENSYHKQFIREDYVDVWNTLHPTEKGYTFDPIHNPLAMAVSKTGKPRYHCLDIVILRLLFL